MTLGHGGWEAPSCVRIDLSPSAVPEVWVWPQNTTTGTPAGDPLVALEVW